MSLRFGNYTFDLKNDLSLLFPDVIRGQFELLCHAMFWIILFISRKINIV